MEQLEEKGLYAALEAVLFASGEPIPMQRLCLALDASEEDVSAGCKHLADEYSYQRRGIRLLKMNDSYQLCSAPEYAEPIRKALERRKPPQLSQPALEVLSVIAYYQPTTRAYVEQVRGVDSSYTVNLLLERGLIQEGGRLDAPGRPVLFQTTELFLRCFGLTSLDDLPALPQSEEAERLAAELLSAQSRQDTPEGEEAPS